MTARHLYFIADSERRFVKIGLSKAPSLRLIDLQAGSPLTLTLELQLLDCTRRDEERLHQHYARHWRHREWFDYAPDIRARVDEALVAGSWSWEGISPIRDPYDPTLPPFSTRYELLEILRREARA